MIKWQKNSLLLIAACFALMSNSVWADREIEKNFEVEQGGMLELDTDMGSIEVETHQSNSIKVSIEIEGLDEDEFDVTFDETSNGLSIEGNKKDSNWGSWGSRRVRFDITVPKHYNLNLHTSGGSIRVDDLVGNAEVDTSGGSLSFGNIEGEIDGRTSGGSIRVEGAKGNVKVRTSGGSLSIGDIAGDIHGRTSGGSIRLGVVSGTADVATSGGSIRIEEVGGQVEAKTSGGSVELTLSKQPKGHSDISTSGGSITAFLAEGIAVDLYARGRKVYSDFEVNGETSAKYKLKGPINGGGPELELQTSAGNVYIKKK